MAAKKTKFPSVKSAGLRGAKAVADKQLKTQATTVAKGLNSAMTAALNFEAGKQDYRLFKPRPPTPTNENCDEPKSMRFYGWMIARSNDVHKIILDIRALGLSEKKSDALVTKRAAALDRAHSPDGRDHGPIW